MVGRPAGIWGTPAELVFPDNSFASDRSFRNHRRIPREGTEAVETVIRSLRYNHDRTDRLDERLQRELNHFRNTGIEWPAAPPGSEPAGLKRRNRECLPERDRAPDEAAWPTLGNGPRQGYLPIRTLNQKFFKRQELRIGRHQRIAPAPSPSSPSCRRSAHARPRSSSLLTGTLFVLSQRYSMMRIVPSARSSSTASAVPTSEPQIYSRCRSGRGRGAISSRLRISVRASSSGTCPDAAGSPQRTSGARAPKAPKARAEPVSGLGLTRVAGNHIQGRLWFTNMV